MSEGLRVFAFEWENVSSREKEKIQAKDQKSSDSEIKANRQAG